MELTDKSSVAQFKLSIQAMVIEKVKLVKILLAEYKVI